MQNFINKLQSSIKEGSFVKLTLSKPNGKSLMAKVEETENDISAS